MPTFTDNVTRITAAWLNRIDTAIQSAGTWVIDKASGSGIKVDTATPTYPWRDLEGLVVPRASAPNAASLEIYRGGSVREWNFALNDVSDNRFHIPHDYVPGTDLHFHVHWSHNGTGISGSIVFTVKYSYSKGHNQAAFSAEKTITLTQITANIGTTPQYQHFILETPITSAGGSASLLDSGLVEVDGLLLVNVQATTVPTITGGSPNTPFIHMIDLHYQSSNIGTKQKSPPFWT